MHNPNEEIVKSEISQKEVTGMSLEIKNLEGSLNGNESAQSKGLLSFEKSIESLGYISSLPETYLASVSSMYGSKIIVRRSKMEPVFSAIENDTSLHISKYDTEPNAAILGSVDKVHPRDSKISGIEASMNGGFDWIVHGKVACVFGFLLTENSVISVSEIPKDSPSHTKEYAHTMRSIEGDVNPKDILFFLVRTHKDFYPEELCEDEDFYDVFDPVTRKNVKVRKQYVLRLYKKIHQTQ